MYLIEYVKYVAKGNFHLALSFKISCRFMPLVFVICMLCRVFCRNQVVFWVLSEKSSRVKQRSNLDNGRDLVNETFKKFAKCTTATNVGVVIIDFFFRFSITNCMISKMDSLSFYFLNDTIDTSI